MTGFPEKVSDKKAIKQALLFVKAGLIEAVVEELGQTEWPERGREL